MTDWRDAIKTIRQACGLTRAEHARRAGLTGPGVSKVLRAGSNPTLASVEKLAAALGCRVRVVVEPAE